MRATRSPSDSDALVALWRNINIIVATREPNALNFGCVRWRADHKISDLSRLSAGRILRRALSAAGSSLPRWRYGVRLILGVSA